MDVLSDAGNSDVNWLLPGGSKILSLSRRGMHRAKF